MSGAQTSADCGCVGCTDPMATAAEIKSGLELGHEIDRFHGFDTADPGSLQPEEQLWVGGDPIGVNPPVFLEMAGARGAQGRLPGMFALRDQAAMPIRDDAHGIDLDLRDATTTLTFGPPDLSGAIFVSAGDTDDPTGLGGEGSGCNRNWNDRCSIYKIQLYRGTATVQMVLKYQTYSDGDGTAGYIQPAVSPSGRMLAVTRSGAPTKRHGRQIVVMDLDMGLMLDVEDGGPASSGTCPPQFPAWYGESYLLYNMGNAEPVVGDDGTETPNCGQASPKDQDQTLWLVGVSAGSSGPSVSYANTAMLGPGGRFELRYKPGSGSGTSEPAAFSDVDVKQPSNASIATVYDPNLASNQKAAAAGEDGNSGVHALITTMPAVYVEAFSGSTSIYGESADIHAAQHPDWSRSGDAILTHVHSPEEVYSDADGNEFDSRNEYVFGQDSHGWTTAAGGGAAFAHQTAESLLAGGFDSTCDSFSHKQGQFCLSDDYIVTGVFCMKGSSSTSGDGILSSRTYLINRGTGVYWDLTGLIEQAMGAEDGSMQSYTATCWRDG